MPDRNDEQDRAQRPNPQVLTPNEARQGAPQGFVRYVMYTAIAAAIIGMLVVYILVTP